MKIAPGLLMLCSCLVALGCVKVRSERVTDGSGAEWRQISCHYPHYCAEEAHRACPAGYTDAYEGRNPREMRIQCKARTPDAATAAAP